MKKFVCSVCGYVYEGEAAPAACPLCGAPADKFVEQKEENLAWADQHVVGVAQGADEEIIQGLRENFNGECSEVGMYLAMARVAHREGSCAGKKALAAKAKQLNLDAIHDTVHEMAKDEARHGCAFAGFLKRYFND